MPIRFRCSYCNRLLGIATRKAGMETTCPHCGYTIIVPVPQQEQKEQDEGRTERINLEDVEELLGNSKTDMMQKSAVAEAPAAPPSAPAAEKPLAESPKPQPTYPKPVPVSHSPAPVASPPAAAPPLQKPRPAPPAVPKPRAPGEEPPLFEQDVDEILGTPVKLEEEEKPKPAAVSGMDAMSLGEPHHQIVISAQKATLLMILVVVLMALSFAAGMLVKG